MQARTKVIALILAAVLSPLAAGAQYRSAEFDRAVHKGTRSENGRPGPKYSNNFAEYKITASFDPGTHLLEGDETVDFHFNTPGKSIYDVRFNLYRNIYKKGIARSRDCAPEDITDEGVEILGVSQVDGGKEHGLDFAVEGTRLVVDLRHGISPGGKATFRVKWRIRVAALTHHRGGKYYDNSWFVPYWYPQIAVYDDIYGWDGIDHSGNEEFLMEFANYDVTLDVGGGMVVWATGDLDNAGSVFTGDFISRRNKAAASNTPVTLFEPGGAGKALKKNAGQWHFKADSVPDFVFACSGEMGWVAMSSPIRSGKPRTLVSAVYKQEGFKSSAEIVKSTLEYLSRQRPAVPYPYSHMTLFEGSGGMEFPMMVNEDFDNDFDSDFFTTSHEVTHSYFPFITGMYQNRFAFMDEGLTQFVPQYFQNKNYRKKDIIQDARRFVDYVACSDDNVPVATPSYSQSNLLVYTVNSYYKPQIMYTVLEDIVGKETMTQILREFVQAWRGKHPHPIDFYNLCSTVSGKDLSEFFHSWMYTTDYADLAVSSVSGKEVTVTNKGRLMVPVVIRATYDDGSKATLRRDALVWSGGKKEVTISFDKPVVRVIVGDDWIPDVNENDNSN